MRTKALLALAGIALAASACTMSRAATVSATSDLSGQGPITVAVSEEHSTDTLRGQVEVWNSEHPDQAVTISVLPTDDSERYSQVRQDAHNGDNAIIEIDTAHLSEFADMGWLSKIPTSAFDTAQFFSASMSATRIGNDMYAAPYAVDTLSLHYRKDLVPTPPETWGELTDICAAHPEMSCLHAPVRPGEGLAEAVLSLASAQTGGIRDLEPTVNQLATGPLVGKDLPKSAHRAAFANGDGLFLLDDIEASSTSPQFGVTDALLSPAGKPLLSVTGLAIPDSAFHKKTALDFLTYITDRAPAQARATNDGLPPAYPNLYGDTQDTYLAMLDNVFAEHSTAASRPAGNWTTSVEHELQQVFTGEQTANDACHALASLLPSG
ncbi:MAG: extracellular solute-binding protein [Corynebacteriales bacterium]|nr:extracellular solute-binding protein [Mycobacteriales bacterium]